MFQRNKKQSISLYSRISQIEPALQSKLQILQHTKTTSSPLHQPSSPLRQTNPNNNKNSRFTLSRRPPSNTQIIVNLILSKVDLPKIRRSTSIPYMNNQSRLSTKQTKQVKEKFGNFKIRKTSEDDEKKYVSQRDRGKQWGKDQEGDQRGEEEDVLSPRKVRKCTVTNFQQVKAKTSPRQKIVIVSTSKLNPQVSINIKHTIKAKILSKTTTSHIKTKTTQQPPTNSPSIHTQPPPQSIPLPLPLPIPSPNPNPTQQKHQRILKDLKNQITDIKMIQFIKGDQEILKLFPIVDLDLLVFKIKKQEIKRKIVNVQKWKIFDYCNVCEWG